MDCLKLSVEQLVQKQELIESSACLELVELWLARQLEVQEEELVDPLCLFSDAFQSPRPEPIDGSINIFHIIILAKDCSYCLVVNYISLS